MNLFLEKLSFWT